MIQIIMACTISLTPADFYSGLPKNPSVTALKPSDFYTPVPAKVGEPDEPVQAAAPDRRRVIVYVDLSDVASLRNIVDDFDKVDGLDFVLKDKRDIPPEGQKYTLPLFHFSYGSGWCFRSGWRGPDEFSTYWSTGNPGEIKKIQVGKVQVRVQSPKRVAKSSGVYHARSYEWHLTSGESANSLRSHLSSPQPEHHGAYFNRSWLNTLSFHELVGLHSDAHNGRVQWQYVNAVEPVKSTEIAVVEIPAGDLTKEEKKVVKEIGRMVYGTRDGKHPGPVGSSIRGFFGDPRYAPRARARCTSSCPDGVCPYRK